MKAKVQVMLIWADCPYCDTGLTDPISESTGIEMANVSEGDKIKCTSCEKEVMLPAHLFKGMG